ncbi:YhgE/Pip domain-containing protein [Alkalicoccobacillus gibsonii]|uniref:YhgE/Pip domain-containing protein n=1 Tax=Alkalicoccobacillus gibsonii TaxID=79881 RepID=UPI00351972A1
MKRVIPATLAATLLIQPVWFTTLAYAEDSSSTGTIYSKDEVIYANLDEVGTVNELYVVNALEVGREGSIIDYGTYDKLTNLTTLSEIKQLDQEQVEINDAPEGMFYYQGNLSTNTNLPWNFDISYILDGDEVSAEELVGNDGSFELHINVTKNEDVDPAFFENYLLQLSIPLDSAIFTQIDAPEATVANAGQNKQLAYTIMPEEEASYTLRANVSNFEMSGIEISALPSSFAIDTPDTEELTGEFDSLTGAISDLNNGLGDVKSGIDALSTGLVQLETGSASYRDGVNEAANGGSELVEASGAIQSGLNQLNEGLSASDTEIDIGLDEDLFGALDQFATGLSELSAGMDELNSHYQEAYDVLKEAINEIPSTEISEEEIQQLYIDNPESEVVHQLVETYAAAQKARATFYAVDEAFQAVQPALEEMSQASSQLEEGMNTFTSSVQEGLQDLDLGEGLEELASGINELASQYGSFHNGLVEYTGGVSQLSSGYQELHNGMSESANGSSELSAGLSDIRGGMTELETATSDIPEQMQEEIDEMISQYDKSDFEAISFVSAENNELVNNVQFVIQTEGIVLPDDTEEASEENDEPSIWQRFLSLFGGD